MDTRRLIALLGLTATVACNREPSPAAPAPAVASAAVPASEAPVPPAAGPKLGPEGPGKVRSTSPAIYKRNQEALEASLRERIRTPQATPGHFARLAALEMEKAQLDGDLAHADAALALLDEAEKKFPGDEAVGARRAAIQAHLHRFGEAIAYWKQRLAAKPDDARIQNTLGDLYWNTGRYLDGARLLALPLPEPLSHEDWAQRAHIAFVTGDPDNADQLLRRAYAAYDDVHPMVLAWIDFLRGHVRLRTGRWAEARAFFAAATDRLPDYIVAAEHLAETELLLGNVDAALKLYDDIVKRTRLPEFIAARGEALRAKGDAPGAEAALLEADREWKARLAKHPHAWAAHAIGFWLDDKPDPAEAAKWAKLNLEVRRDAMSLLQAARALAPTDPAQARLLVGEAARSPLRYDEYFEALGHAHAALGEPDKARQAFARAAKYNPRVEVPAEPAAAK